jgi:hypothetical protein
VYEKGRSRAPLVATDPGRPSDEVCRCPRSPSGDWVATIRTTDRLALAVGAPAVLAMTGWRLDVGAAPPGIVGLLALLQAVK